MVALTRDSPADVVRNTHFITWPKPGAATILGC